MLMPKERCQNNENKLCQQTGDFISECSSSCPWFLAKLYMLHKCRCTYVDYRYRGNWFFLNLVIDGRLIVGVVFGILGAVVIAITAVVIWKR